MLEAIPCPEHKQCAKVTMEFGKIEITACCEQFRASLQQLASQEYVKVLDAAVVDVLDHSKSDM
jgi:hypothetical protein